jgi:hypothetical protein
MSTKTLSIAIADARQSAPVSPEEAPKQEKLTRALSDVLLNERLPVAITIPGVEDVAPYRRISKEIISVLAQRGFVVNDRKLQDTISGRIGTIMGTEAFPAVTLRTAALTGTKPPLPTTWQDLPNGSLPSLSNLDRHFELPKSQGQRSR